MAATENVSHLSVSYNSAPRPGVITAYGYGINIRVKRGHLLIDHGVGTKRQQFRLARVGHGLKRLVVIGSAGVVSLAALRWLSDQDVSFAMLERRGKVLAVTGPVRPSDARLRRAQALAFGAEAGLSIARELIFRKVIGQEQVVRDILHDPITADEIAHLRDALPDADGLDVIRTVEFRAAAAYWSAWRNVPVTFPSKDLPRVPEHWRTFGTRKSQLTGSPRLAVNPPNAILNYFYAVLEAESRLAAAALGLDPGLGVLHMDTTTRDSLACDLMEAVRPQVDRYLLKWILSQPLRREWFFEQRDGNCRLMAQFAAKLSETASTWASAVAPLAEWVARALWSTPLRQRTPLATRLTQQHRREAANDIFIPKCKTPPKLPRICSTCGGTLKRGQRYCGSCVKSELARRMPDVARHGRLLAHTDRAQASRAQTQHMHQIASRSWDPKSQPLWLSEETYRSRIQPALANMKTSAIASAMGVSFQYASAIRRGLRRPHPRHWRELAQLSGFDNSVSTTKRQNFPSRHRSHRIEVL